LKEISHLWPKYWSEKTLLMGVLNVTPDSFSDGGCYLNQCQAINHASFLLSSGASVIDIGGQSTRPGAFEVGAKVELARIIPVIKEVRLNFPQSIISVDTFLSEVAEKAIEAGANWINDISGGRRDSNIFRVAAKSNKPIVITHSKGNSQTMNSLALYDNTINEVIKSLEIRTEKAINSGVCKDNIIWDPGLGFAKETKHNIYILENLKLLKAKGFPVLLGPSRKRFIGDILNLNEPKDRLFGTIGVCCLATMENIEMLRVHDVKEVNHAITIINKICKH
tara:strand:- start:5295 stop:6134 length:840 start_codon:yes stop_codon:yes gene_type:complete